MTNETTFLARVDQPSAGNAAANLKKFDADTNPVLRLNYINGTLDEDGNVVLGGGDLSLDQGTPAAPEDDGTLVEVSIFNDVTGQWELVGTYEFIYEFSGTTPTAQNQGAGFVPDELEGQDAAIVTVLGYPSTTEDTRMFFLPELQYNEDPSLSDISIAQMEAFEQGRMNLGNLNNNPVDVCFLSGTEIQTPQGWSLVDDLGVGDTVMTADGSGRTVSWVTSTLHVWDGVDAHNKPILISKGALGAATPSEDLMVSPQHNILFNSDLCLELFGTKEVLAPAKGLTGLPGVRVMSGKKSAEYYHVMTEKHEILLAHGVETESFYPGPTAVRMLNAGQRASLFAVVPALRDDPEGGYGPTARPRITRRQAEQLVDAMKAAKNKNAAVAIEAS